MSSSLINLIDIQFQDTDYTGGFSIEASSVLQELDAKKMNVTNLLQQLGFLKTKPKRNNFSLEKLSNFKQASSLGGFKHNSPFSGFKHASDANKLNQNYGAGRGKQNDTLADENYDVSLVYNCIDLLTEFTSDLAKAGIRNEDFFISLLLLIKLYHNQGYVILYLNYISSSRVNDGASEDELSWKKAQYCFQCANGISKLLLGELEKYAKGRDNKAVLTWDLEQKINLIVFFNISYQEFAYVAFALFKVQHKILERYTSEDFFETSKNIDGLTYGSIAKMILKITNMCNVMLISGTEHCPEEIKVFYKEYLTALLFIFQALQLFTVDNKVGASCGFINRAHDLLKNSRVFRKDMNKYEREEYQNWSKKKENRTTLNSKVKLSVLKNRPKEAHDLPSGPGFSDQLIVKSFEQFIVPLVFILKFRFENYNNLVAFETVPSAAELNSLMPILANKSSDLKQILADAKSIDWEFKNGFLASTLHVT